MRRPSSRSRWLLAAGALALAAAGAAAWRVLAPAARAPLAENAPRSADSPERPAPAAAQAGAAAAPPAAERGYVRRLVVVEPPEPGAKPRDTRDASVVAEETAVDPRGAAAGSAASLTPGALGAADGPAGSGAFASAGGPSLVAPPSDGRAGSGQGTPRGGTGQARRDAGSGGRRGPPGAGADGVALSAAASDAARLLAGARSGLKSIGTAHEGPLTPAAIAQDLRSQLAQDRKTDTAVRDALQSLPPGATEDQKEEAVAGALDAAGAPSGPEDVAQAMSIAAQPPGAAPSPQALDGAVQQMAANPPDEETLDRLSQLAMKPEPKPNAPPPKGGVQAYLQYQDAFDRADHEYNLKPYQVVPFPAIETSLGRNTGKYPLRDTLLSIAEDPKGRFKPGQRKQAGHDLAAMTRLIASGDLGGRSVDQLYGSNMGAIGITQFLPSSWEAYGVAFKSGAHKSPWDFRDAVLSTANYLDKHHAQQSYDKAILSYNYSQDYLNKIKQYGANVAPGIQAVKQAQAEGTLPPPGQGQAAAPATQGR